MREVVGSNPTASISVLSHFTMQEEVKSAEEGRRQEKRRHGGRGGRVIGPPTYARELGHGYTQTAEFTLIGTRYILRSSRE
jgi:hypothetical protein